MAKKQCLITLICLFLAINNLSLAKNNDIADYQDTLNSLRESITSIQDSLKETQSDRSHILNELQKLELDISNNSIEVKKSREKKLEASVDAKKLQKELNLLELKLNTRREVLARQIQSEYALGEQQQIKMLLNQQNPDEIGRTLIYFDYFSKARKKQISQFLTVFEKKQKTEARYVKVFKEKSRLAKMYHDQSRLLSEQRRTRSRLLAKLTHEIQNQEQTLSELEESRNEIEDLLTSLGELLADIPATPSEDNPFYEQKGYLPWPVDGPFLATYDTARDQGDLKWKGVLIGAAYGQPVKAVSYGRIAFADWLQGYGFITIIDHGDGYMSLYGHNESQFKQAGDWVETGEVIATTGDSGGQKVPGLYFEIRLKGKPVNPDAWCSSTIKHSASI